MIASSIAEMIGDVTPAQATIAVSAITALVSIATLVYSKKGHDAGKKINQAVNGNAPGTPRLFDLVARHGVILESLQEWKSSHDSGPWRSADEMALWKVQNEESMRDLIREIKAMRKSCPACRVELDDLAKDVAEIRKIIDEKTDGV